MPTTPSTTTSTTTTSTATSTLPLPPPPTTTTMPKLTLRLPGSLHVGQPIDTAALCQIKFVKRFFFALFNDRSHNKAKSHTTASTYTAASIQAAVNEYIRFEDFLRSVGRGNPVFKSLLGDMQECARFASEMEKKEGYSHEDEVMEGMEEEVEEVGRQLQLMAVSSTEGEPKGKNKRSRDDEDVEVILEATKKMKL
ncbi:hypothetical protein D6C84_05786 [Aureobasidium pullulans]|uniref:Uncharacterized protein n=1 Tax=Aureobasidium pullulans TaxID=5580 RepID=A0A4S9XRD0_AURPU|nr:hypothetical protein D6C84_05786 [Aureobasidium pullulans]